MQKSSFRTQDVASYAAVLVAIVALYVGWEQARIIRNQQHADVYPVVEINTQYVTSELEDGKTYRVLKLDLFNAGVGPAFIESAHWSIGKNVIEHPSDIVRSLPQGLSPVGQYQGQFENLILAPGNREKVWEVAFPNDQESNALAAIFMQDFWAMDLQVCYCSLYERCWVTAYNAESPRPVQIEACPAD